MAYAGVLTCCIEYPNDDMVSDKTKESYQRKTATMKTIFAYSFEQKMAYPPSTFNPTPENNVDSFNQFEDEYDPEFFLFYITIL